MVGIAIVVFGVCCLLPVGYLLTMSLTGTDGRYAAVLLDARQRGLLYNTALLGTGTALLATAIGAPLGVALARIALPRKALLRLTLAAPVLLPPYVVGLAWIYLGGSRGLVATLAGRDLLSGWTYSLPAGILVLSLVLYPLSMLATEVAMRRIDGRLEEAALIIAPPGRVLWRITLPLAAPSIFGAALVIFVLAVSEFGVPGLLRVRVYTTEVFTAFAALYDFSRAVLVAVPLLLLCLTVACVAAALLGERLVITRRSAGTRPAFLDAWRRAAVTGALVVVAVALGLPLAVLVREALGARSLSAVLGGSGDAIANSLVLATAGATAVLSVAVWLGYSRARARGRIGQVADVLFVVVFAVPTTIVGVGLIGLWNRPGVLGAVYGTDFMFLLAYLARFVPVAALALAASTRYVPVSHEEAAAVSGAGWLRTMFRIVLPQIRLGLAAAWLISFVLAFGELGVSILVAPPGEATLPIRIYTIIANTPSSHVAVLALLQTLVIFTPLAALGAAVSLRRSTCTQGVPSVVEGREGR
ncbi:MAG: iron ABC transporter permease [Acidobacteriota bacterium]|nr:iron ABC transporter permease [Acidobacteriota bacterium]